MNTSKESGNKIFDNKESINQLKISTDKKGEEMNVLLCFDDIDWNYTRHAAVTIISLLETNKKHNIKIWIITSELSKENINELKRIIRSYNQEIQFIIRKDIVPRELKDIIINKNKLTRWARYRLFFPKYIKWINRILYIDCDILVVKDIYDIYTMNMWWKAIAWYYDAREWQWDFFNTKNYINSWVMLFDIKKYDTKKINPTKMQEVNIKYSKYFTGSDQDKINVIFKDDIHIWPSKMNYQITSKYFNKWILKASIIHCIWKPYIKYWLIPDKYTTLYNNYLNLTKWKWFPMENPDYWYMKYLYMLLRDLVFQISKKIFWWKNMYKLMLWKRMHIKGKNK